MGAGESDLAISVISIGPVGEIRAVGACANTTGAFPTPYLLVGKEVRQEAGELAALEGHSMRACQ